MTEIMYYKIISKYMIHIRIQIQLHLGFGPIVWLFFYENGPTVPYRQNAGI